MKKRKRNRWDYRRCVKRRVLWLKKLERDGFLIQSYSYTCAGSGRELASGWDRIKDPHYDWRAVKKMKKRRPQEIKRLRAKAASCGNNWSASLAPTPKYPQNPQPQEPEQ